ncbi:hypothetical protein BOX15_Mlig018234g1 [Macrostomum lignano]|uniref:Cytochrome P450 n=1 Tax=Macrostomum lignano TaxID=282301 RepID=A0A267GRQ7_9PLAT|nr:hypothetical protein BOX15_Mlig018234g1 [Macrostomum lignano]
MQILGTSLAVPNWLLYSALAAAAAYAYGAWPYRYWKRRGIRGPLMLPYLEGTLELAKMKDFRDMMMTELRRYGRVYGTYFMRQPVLVVADPEMVKQICVKRAENFIDRSTFGMDFSPLNKGVLMLKGQEWKRVRSLLSPTFSSGKIKAMYPLIEQCSNQLCASLLKAPEETVDIKKYLMNFTMDAVACTMFGLQVNAQEDENSEFKKHTNEVFNMSMRSWKFWALILFPRITKPLFCRFRISLFKMETLDFFQTVISQALREREASENADKYSDFLASMVEARREAESQGLKGLTEEEVMAQSLTFFLGGLETTATALQYLAYFLAFNKQCQERAYLEVIEARDKHGGTLSYECVQGLKYLGHCIDESMRMCPPVMMSDRICTETTVVNGYEIEKDVLARIPIYTLAHDPELWDDPETFNPDRFDEANSAERDAARLIPFGLGPRGCIAMRLAQVEIRKAMAEMLLRLEFSPADCTEPFERLQFKLAPVLTTKEPIRLRVRQRGEL